MSEKDGSQQRIYHDSQSRGIDLSQAFEERMDPIPVRTSTPPPPHIKWPIIYPEQLELVQTAIMPALPPSTPNPLLTETGRQRGKKLLDYALATASPPNEPTRLAFPQLPNTPIPALDLMDLEASPHQWRQLLLRRRYSNKPRSLKAKALAACVPFVYLA
ncbi:hypothetical protein [Ktedonospora formicarum]|uniref:hypothetical protein n=1 Tax=Ktedonospora formicarum TaxID=2778364 RepID=UPI001C6893FE|nr:hypothetical protein [Ktedonospora formicarum]